MIAPETWERLERLWRAFMWQPLRRFLRAAGDTIARLVSREGLLAWGTVFLAFSVFFGWINTPFGGAVRGVKISLVPAFVDLDDPALRPFSYGAVILAVLLVTWLTRPGSRVARVLPAWFGRPLGYHAAVGVMALCLALWFFLSVAFVRPELLESLIEQNGELAHIKQFDNAYIQGNVGVVRTTPLSDDTLWDQLGALSAHLGAGFWYAIASGTCLLLGGIRKLRKEADSRRDPPWALLGATGVAVVLVLLAGGLVGQSLLGDALVVRADAWAGKGDYPRALVLYRRARNLDHRLAINETFIEKMGRAAYRAGDRGAPEADFYMAHRYRWEYDYPMAVWHMERAIGRLETSQRTVTLPAYQEYLEQLLVYWGRTLYDRGRYQGAVERWQKAFLLDPDSFELAFFLAHAYYEADGRDQSRAIKLNELLLGRIHDRILRSDIYCNLGEAYYRQKDYAEARIMYERSLDMYNFVKDINYRAQKGMVGL